MGSMIILKVAGGLSGRMTWQFLNTLESFSSEKTNFSTFVFLFNKKEPQSRQFASYWRKALFEFLTSQTDKMAFMIFKVIVR